MTFTCHKWLPLFEETKLYENIYNWLKLLNEKNIKTVGFVLMPNYLHWLLYLPKEAPELYKIISNAKRFMAYEIVKRLEQAGKTALLAKLEEGVKAKEGKSKRCPKANCTKFLKKVMMLKSVLIKILSFKK